MSMPREPNESDPQSNPGGWGTPPGEQRSDQNPGNQQWGDQNPGNQQWGNPPYGAPAGYGGPPPKQSNGMGTGALVLGIIGLLLSIFVIGGVIGLVAVILGFIGRGKVKRGEASNGGQALAGIITGVIAILVSIAVMAAGAAFFSQIRECTDPSLTQAEVDQCLEDELINNQS